MLIDIREYNVALHQSIEYIKTVRYEAVVNTNLARPQYWGSISANRILQVACKNCKNEVSMKMLGIIEREDSIRRNWGTSWIFSNSW